MNAEQIKEFTPHWSSEAKNYVLVRLNPHSLDLRNCVIVEKRGVAHLIKDPDVALEVMQNEWWMQVLKL